VIAVGHASPPKKERKKEQRYMPVCLFTGLGVDDQKQCFASMIVLESSNLEELQIGWFVLF